MYFVVDDDNDHIEIPSDVRQREAILIRSTLKNEEKALEIRDIVQLLKATKSHAWVLKSYLNAYRKKYIPLRRLMWIQEKEATAAFYIYLLASRNWEFAHFYKFVDYKNI